MKRLRNWLLSRVLNWHDISKDQPVESGSYLIYTRDGNIGEAEYQSKAGVWFQYRWSVLNPKVVKWIKLSDLLP